MKNAKKYTWHGRRRPAATSLPQTDSAQLFRLMEDRAFRFGYDLMKFCHQNCQLIDGLESAVVGICQGIERLTYLLDRAMATPTTVDAE